MTRYALPLLTLITLASVMPAQISPCFLGDDGFAVGCCVPVQPNLPQFPAMTSAGRHACIRNCTVESDTLLTVALSNPNFLTCDIAVINATILPGGPGAPGYSGALLAKYARTWAEPGITGGLRQVWRFLVNGELAVNTATIGLAGCPTPLSLPNTNFTVHWWGSIDYICDVSTIAPSAYQMRLDLNHGPNCLQYAPWTTYAGALPAGAPNRSYHIVAPANFVFAPVPVPAGPTPFDAVRDTRVSPTGIFCLGEARANGMLQNVNQNCLCSTIATAPGLWMHQNLTGAAFCAGTVSPYASLPLPGTPFPTGFVSMSLGFFMPGILPGALDNRAVVIHWGVLQYQSPCTNNFPINVVHGVTTSNHQAMPFPLNPAVGGFNHTMDLANHKSLAAAFSQPGGFPIFGSLSYADEVWNLNLP